ncbi:MAG: zinc ribbon domain-containing protein [bacterium]
MPIFEYHCRSCDKKFEKLVLRRDMQVQCPQCRADEVERLISVCSFGSADRSVRPASQSNCGSCHASSCTSCKH